MRMNRFVLSAAVTAALVVPAGAASAAENPDRANPNASKSATLLYFNDAHDIRPVLTGGQDRGGVARLATVINTVRDERPETQVVFGGDLAGGTLFGGLYKGFPIVDAFNDIGIDLANFGQHDFDFGVENARQLVAASEFPWISSNLMDSNGEPFAPGGTYREMRVGKIDIGFLGLTDALETSSAGSGIRQLDTIALANAAVTAMQAKNRPDVIIAVTQMPLDANRALLEQVPQIDAVFTEEVAEYDSVITEVGGKFVMAPEGNMGSMIRLDVTRTSGGYSVTPSVLEVDHTVTPDPQLKLVEERYEAEIQANLSTPLAVLQTPLVIDGVRARETNAGNFVADAYRHFHGTDIGWMNGGGIRDDATGTQFTKLDAYAMVPFANKVMKVSVTGAGIRQALEDGVARVATQGGGFPQVSGMTYAYSPANPVGSRVGAITVGGAPLDATRVYTAAVTNYVVNGGDGITGFANATVLVPEIEAPTDAEAVVQYASSLGTINVGLEGRITVQ
jgi:2',3'-cyclic-nucleotide 2'-phosphodiesterase (5'-nucleotidase family)